MTPAVETGAGGDGRVDEHDVEVAPRDRRAAEAVRDSRRDTVRAARTR